MITETFKNWVLSLPTDKKIDLLKSAYKDNYGAWFQLAQIYLDAPIHQGGLPTEVIESTRE
jgi:hypothetical protein